jgi:hypothetical protein
MIKSTTARLVAMGTWWTAGTQERLDVRIVRVLVRRIDQEDNGIDLTLRDARGDLGVATLGSRGYTLDIQAHLVDHQAPGGAGCRQVELAELVSIEGGESYHIGLLAVVSNESDCCFYCF